MITELIKCECGRELRRDAFGPEDQEQRVYVVACDSCTKEIARHTGPQFDRSRLTVRISDTREVDGKYTQYEGYFTDLCEVCITLPPRVLFANWFDRWSARG